MDAFDAINAVAVVAALVCASAAPRDRMTAIASAMLLAGNWLLYVASYWAVPPAAALWALGATIRSEELWGLADCVCACAILALAHHRWWGWALWGLYTAQCLMHVVYIGGWVSFPPYVNVLDRLFLAQVGTFILIGGGGIVDWMRGGFDRLRSFFCPPVSAHAREKP